MRRVASLATIGALVLSAGCYHATIETGRPASTTIVQNQWASSWIAGLVPPATVNVASQCPNGVSKVETEHSFLNMLAQFVTFSIYSPMTITVTCASGGGSGAAAAEAIEAGDTLEEQTAAFSRAAERSAETGQPVLVVFSR
jgi:hypothetical protein